MRRTISILALTGALLAGCSSDDGGDDTSSDTTEAAAATTTTAVAVDDAYTREIVETLAADDLEGRDNLTPGSTAAQEYLTGLLAEIAEPLPDAPDEYAWEFNAGTNLIGVIPGGERAGEYLLLGAHYDALGADCRPIETGDTVCNGAADNAAGVASVLTIARALAEQGPERSVIVALWDAEEDGLLGAHAYVADPAIPLDDTVAYLNWDIQGTNLTPSLSDTTVVVGAETGGPNLVAASEAATAASDLDALDLSLLFGQGRSDHAPFAEAGVPVVFYTDANNGCYHTTQDDVTTLDFDKLARQVPIGMALAEDLVATDDVPEFDPDVPAASFADAESMLAVVSASEPDFDLFPDSRAAVEEYLVDLQAIVDAGEAAFDDAAVSTLLGGAVEVVEALAAGECTGFLD